MILYGIYLSLIIISLDFSLQKAKHRFAFPSDGWFIMKLSRELELKTFESCTILYYINNNLYDWMTNDNNIYIL